MKPQYCPLDLEMETLWPFNIFVLARKPPRCVIHKGFGEIVETGNIVKSFDLCHFVISTNGRNLPGCRKYPHQSRFLALLGMTMEGILKNLRFQKTFKRLIRQKT
jgi:hypothetical protein